MTDDLDDPHVLQRAIADFGVSPILKRYGSWAVTTHGIECLKTFYQFSFERTSELDWVEHMRSKTWVKIPDFVAALEYAREIEAQRQKLRLPNGPLSVFLCHAKEDREEIRRVHNYLVAVGTDPWLDEEDLLPGQNWQHEIKRQIPKSDLVVAFLSRTSVGKTGYVQRELRMAVEAAEYRPEGTIYVIPARLDDCQLPDSLAKYQGVDLFKPDGLNRLHKSLVALSARLTRDQA